MQEGSTILAPEGSHSEQEPQVDGRSMLGSLLPLKEVQQLFPQGWLYGACPREYCIKACWSCWSSPEVFQSLYYKPLTTAQEPSSRSRDPLSF